MNFKKIKRKHWETTFFVFLPVLMVLLSLNAHSQDYFLKIEGNVFDANTAIRQAKITAKGNKQTFTTESHSNGFFELKLPFDDEYILKMEKDGYATVMYNINTTIPTEQLRDNRYLFKIETEMFPKYSGIDMSVLDRPVAYIKFDLKYDDFGIDQYKTGDSFSRMIDLKKQVDKYHKLKAKYDEEVESGDMFFQARQYEKARDFYQKSLSYLPNENYPKEKLQEIRDILENNKSQNSRYDELIAQGDRAFNKQELIRAKTYYEKALQVKPDEQYPQIQINKIDLLLQQEKDKENNYNKLIATADQNFDLKNYSEALQNYSKALEIFPGKTHPQQRINEIKQIQNQQNNLSQQYTEQIRLADAKYSARDYAEAKLLYQNALEIKPNEAYPKNQIALCDQALQQMASKRAQYNQLIASADQFFTQKSYPDAKSNYEQALGLFPNESYPKQKIDEINQILLRLKNLDQQYTEQIRLADAKYSARDYAEAKLLYQKALEIKPNEAYPKNQIALCDQALQQMASKRAQYNQLIASADQFFTQKSYPDAKSNYEQALGLFPNESYPRQKIDEINQILLRLKNLDQQYTEQIRLADAKYSARDYAEAKLLYQKALEIKPNEAYPKNQIALCDQALQQMASKRAQYNQLIASADQFFTQKSYPDAKSNYERALGLFPNESYPRQKIDEINILLQKISENDGRYNQLISSADMAFSKKDYTNAIQFYNSALEVKPNEIYPKQKIAEINRILSETKQKDNEYLAAIAKGDQAFGSNQLNLAKDAYQQALQIKPGASYPRQQIGKIETMLKEQDRLKLYEQIMANGNVFFQQADYTNALDAFKKASSLFPEKPEPKEKINQINNILAGKLAKKRQYDQVIAEADQAFNNSIMDRALNKYKEAISIMPNEPYPRQKIDEIESLLAQRQMKDKEYQDAIQQADALYHKKMLPEALKVYQKAERIKPWEEYPKSKIAEINAFLSQQQSTKQQYNEYVSNGDRLFNIQKYKEAKQNYEYALGVFPNEAYPKQKIAEINKILANNSGTNIAYSNAIQAGDMNFRSKDYETAKRSYQQALKAKPGDSYANNKIKEIDRIIAENRQVAKYYSIGYIEVYKGRKNIGKNAEEKFGFTPFDKKKTGSYVTVVARNSGSKTANVFFNYGENAAKGGGFTFKIPPSSESNEFRVPVSSHPQWITDRNNWISIYPAGSSIEVSEIKIYFGD